MKQNIKIKDNGSAYMITVDGLIICHQPSLGDAWQHIVWMYRIASQDFTVGDKRTPIEQWIEGMQLAGYIEY